MRSAKNINRRDITVGILQKKKTYQYKYLFDWKTNLNHVFLIYSSDDLVVVKSYKVPTTETGKVNNNYCEYPFPVN